MDTTTQDTNRIVAYCANEELPTPWIHSSGRESWYARKTGTSPWRGTLTDWGGNKVGTYVIKSRRASRAYGGCDPTYYISATINGRDYYGQTQGPGMHVSLKAYKNQ
jgi:hypothetical protein